jgi:hypothetical protein
VWVRQSHMGGSIALGETEWRWSNHRITCNIDRVAKKKHYTHVAIGTLMIGDVNSVLAE